MPRVNTVAVSYLRCYFSFDPENAAESFTQTPTNIKLQNDLDLPGTPVYLTELLHLDLSF